MRGRENRPLLFAERDPGMHGLWFNQAGAGGWWNRPCEDVVTNRLRMAGLAIGGWRMKPLLHPAAPAAFSSPPTWDRHAPPIRTDDALRDAPTAHADVVVTNPPFGKKSLGHDRQRGG